MRFNEKRLGLVIIILALARIVALGIEHTTHQHHRLLEPSKRNTLIECQVLTVYDGDTMGCDLNKDGHIERPDEEVRLLGIDTPEMHYSRKNKTHDTAHPFDEPFAKEASQWTESHALNKTVYLEFDQRKTDRYHRLLAFVYTTPQTPVSLNLELLKLGYARLLFLGKNRLHEAEFQAVEDDARTHQRGLWGQSSQP